MNTETKKCLFCSYAFTYDESLTYGKRYLVIDWAPDKESVLIQDDREKINWFPRRLFSTKAPVRLIDWSLDQEIPDDNFAVEVTISLSNHARRWFLFATPKYITHELSRNTVESAFFCQNLVLVSRLTIPVIEKALRYIESCGALVAQSKGLK